MPRGASKDKRLTKLLRENDLLLDPRSFVGYDLEMIPHLYLKGEDMSVQRQLIFRRSFICKLQLEGCEDVATELDHKQGGIVGRCDCRHNLQPVCHSCHERKHNRSPQLKWIPEEQKV
jgi:hypothetical protein